MTHTNPVSYPLNPELLTSLETCPRQAQWSRKWQSEKLHPTEIVYRAMWVALTSTERNDRGELAGETVVSLCADRGLDTQHYDVYGIGMHHAALADILVSYLTQESNTVWYIPPEVNFWQSRCFLVDDRLRRVILVDHWSDDRLAAECHSWYSLGEMASYELPMDLQVLVLGASRNGRRYSPWTRGLLHPKNRQLRFAKRPKTKRKLQPFEDSWQAVWREEHDQISRDEWLCAMEKDSVMQDLSIVHRLELPSAERLQRVRADMRSLGEWLDELAEIPEKRYGVCDWPKRCQFNRCCWGPTEILPSQRNGYVPILQDAGTQNKIHA